jgi:hypothetical protein
MAAVLLECGHAVSELIEVDGEPRCGACQDSEPIDSEAVEGAVEETEQERQDAATEGAAPTLPQPAHGIRALVPGPRGCMALTVRGDSCGAAKRGDSDFCNAHAGVGVSRDPRAYLAKAQETQQRNRAIRAQMRLQLGNTRPTGPRAALQAMAMVESKRLARTAIDAALDPSADPIRAGGLALRVIEAVDPRSETTLELRTDLSPEDVDRLSYSELIRVAEAWNIGAPDPSEAPPAGLPRPATTPPEGLDQAI